MSTGIKWLTPELFERSARMERKHGGGGFGVLVSAAWHCADKGLRDLISTQWNVYDLGAWAVEEGERSANEEGSPCLAWLAAASLHADLDNRRKLDAILPGIDREVAVRYNTSGSLVPGEVMEISGTIYVCEGEVVDGQYGYEVNTAVRRVA